MHAQVMEQDREQTIAELFRSQRPGFSLDSAFYRRADIYRRDIERIFMCCWLYAGHTSLIPETGDYFLFEIADESVIVARDESGEVNALANVCRHRGSRVCREASGRAKTFVCGYHGWVYSLDGSLRSKRYMPDDFDPTRYGLKRVAVRVFHGLIFVCFAEQPTDFERFTAPLDPLVKPLGLGRTMVAARRNYQVEANWKLALENYIECYHCGPAHPEYARAHPLRLPNEEVAKLRRTFLERCTANGLSTDSIDSGYNQDELGSDVFFNRTPLFEGVLSGSEDAQPVAPLLGDLVEHDGGTVDLGIGPVTFLLVYTDHAVVYRFTPRDIQRSDMEVTWLVNESAVEGVDYDLDKLIWMWDVTSQADKRIINDNQSGINSRFYEPGPFSKMEDYTDRFARWYLDAISPAF